MASLEDSIELRILTPDDEAALAALFASQDSGVTQWFDPFPLDADEAHRIAHHDGRDLYWGVFRDGRLIGLLMVRGWDEGHEHRGLGIFLDPRDQGGMIALHCGFIVADHLRSIGETSLRINIHEKNGPALHVAGMIGFEEVERRGPRVIFEVQLDNPVTFRQPS